MSVRANLFCEIYPLIRVYLKLSNGQILVGNIVLEAGLDESSSTQKLCLENIVKLYLRVRSFSHARQYIIKSLIRMNLKRSKDN